MKRNDSEIMKLLMGQFKSTVDCPDCENISYKFDPFYIISVPIPQIRMARDEIYFMFDDTWTLPKKIKYTLAEKTSVAEIRILIG